MRSTCVTDNVTCEQEGLDMYFKTKNQAQRIVAFVNTLFPTITRTSKKLIGKDTHSHQHRNEYTISMEVVPLCRFDVVVTPKESGRAPELMIVSQLSTNAHLLNPKTLAKIEWNAPKFFGKPVKPILTAKNLIKFIVLNITPISTPGTSTVFTFDESRDTRIKDKGGVLAEAEVARESDFGVNDIIFQTVTHLGHILKPGDTALGYDLTNVVMDIANESRYNDLADEPLEIILIKKSFEKTGEKKKKKKRNRRQRRGKARDSEDLTGEEQKPGANLIV